MSATEKIDQAVQLLREAQDEIPAGQPNSPEDVAVFDLGLAVNTAMGAKRKLELEEERRAERKERMMRDLI